MPFRRGIGAVCSVKKRYLHSKSILKTFDEWDNTQDNDLIPGWTIVGIDMRKTHRKRDPIQCVLLENPLYKHEEPFYCAVGYAKVNQEGPPHQLFGNESVNDHGTPARVAAAATNTNDNTNGGDGQRDEGEDSQRATRGELGDDIAGNIAFLRSQGFSVDDDTEPAPENIPADGNTTPVGNTQAGGLCDGQEWRNPHLDPRRANNVHNVRPSLSFMPRSQEERAAVKKAFMFETMVGRDMLQMICTQTSAKLEANNHKDLQYGEFLRWIGLWLLLATVKSGGVSRQDFWSTSPVSIEEGAPFRLHGYMSRYRFDLILSHVKYTSEDRPAYHDKFHEVREMIKMWNGNINEHFKSGYINCLDESMSVWHNRYTCPGWMYVPRKPHPFGNEYHTICCGLCGIMFGIHLSEGKDRPEELRRMDDPQRHGKTVNLLKTLCSPLQDSGKILVLDSGFCVLAGIIVLVSVLGIYAAAQIKKRCYWPLNVPGESIKNHMKDKPNGTLETVCGEQNGIRYSIFCLKEPSYCSMIMSTYGSLAMTDYEASRFIAAAGNDGTNVSFHLNDVFSNHFLYRHMVDDHNHLRHEIPAIEDTWKTTYWPNRQFAFILGISEVNSYKAFEYFVWKPLRKKPPSLTKFRKELALELIHNEYLCVVATNEDTTNNLQSPRRSARQGIDKYDKASHNFMTAAPGAKRFVSGAWEIDESRRYFQHRCETKGCQERVRTYCSCTIGQWKCAQCFGEHCFDVGYKSCNSTDSNTE